MEYLGDYARYIVVAFFGLLPVANPFSTAPVFLSLTSDMSAADRAKVARLTAMYMTIILLVFLFVGVLILDFFGITVEGLRAAGGLIILVMGMRMLFPAPKQQVEVDTETSDFSIAFTPLAMPISSGPGSIAVVIGMAADIARTGGPVSDHIGQYVFIICGILLVVFVTWLVLSGASKVVRFLGASGIDAMTRIMGFFLVAIGVEFILRSIMSRFG